MNRMQNIEDSVSRHVLATQKSKKRQRKSRAMFGTGEHVIAGEDSATARLSPSKKYLVNGVDFTYGQIIAMADLYETYDHMVAAPASELRRIRDLIDRSTRHFRRYWNRAIPDSATSNTPSSDWEAATGKGGRKSYTDLARINYAHFAPSNPSLVSRASGPAQNHKSAWEAYHRRALAHAARGRSSNDLDTALTINAFGDHFLTDAFASGHLFNKNDVAQRFKQRAYSGTSLNRAGEAMINATAAIAWRDRGLKTAFSRIEVIVNERPWVNIDINSLENFRRFLRGLAEAKPGLVAGGLIAKVIHDELNATWISVQGENRSFRIKGDSHMNDEQLRNILAAVRQSVQNVEDAVTGNVSAATAIQRVWAKVPRPSRESTAHIRRRIETLTNPRSPELHRKAAEVLIDEYRTIIKQGLEDNLLGPADRSVLDRGINLFDWIVRPI